MKFASFDKNVLC